MRHSLGGDLPTRLTFVPHLEGSVDAPTTAYLGKERNLVCLLSEVNIAEAVE